MFGLAIGHLSILLAIPVLGAGLLIFMPRRQTYALFAVALVRERAQLSLVGENFRLVRRH